MRRRPSVGGRAWRALRDERGHQQPGCMLIVAIIGILAAIAIPKFADLIRRSNDGATRGNLGAIRSALSIFYGDYEGRYPFFLGTLAARSKYLLIPLPKAKTNPYHPDSARISIGRSVHDADDKGGWLYVNRSKDWGRVYVNCWHTDAKGSVWTVY